MSSQQWMNSKKRLKKKVDIKKSSGPDKISGIMLKKLPGIAIHVLATLFNSILLLGEFPKCWKTSEIIMVPKPGKDNTKVESYRPISLLSLTSKLFEKVLLAKIMPFLTDNQTIPTSNSVSEETKAQ